MSCSSQVEGADVVPARVLVTNMTAEPVLDCKVDVKVGGVVDDAEQFFTRSSSVCRITTPRRNHVVSRWCRRGRHYLDTISK